jgi:putative hemin transport protein
MNATATLKEQWMAFREQNPKMRIRDAATSMKVSEAELVAACAGTAVKSLISDFPAFIQRMKEVGKVMVLTRNENCVIERKGLFEMVNTENKHVGTVLGKDIDLRMFFSKWKFGFAVNDDAETGLKKSWQIFDAQGNAIVKIYPADGTDLHAWERVEKDFVSAEQPDFIMVSPAVAPPVYTTEVDAVAFIADWSALQDTHDFFPMLMKYKVSRVHALELAEGRFARRVSNDCVKTILEDAAASGLDIMVFVGNPGNIEIHTGPVAKILEIPSWINVMDPDFNLHLKTDGIAQCWVVEKPSVDGVVTSVEVFDATGDMIVQFFGKRKPGNPELQAWRDLTKKLS